jgi:hypothetical protein
MSYVMKDAKYEYHIKKIQDELKVFPDYRHLLLENHVEYKHIFFLPLFKLVPKKLLESSYIKKNCILRSSLVINVCNQGKTLWSLCTLTADVFIWFWLTC